MPAHEAVEPKRAESGQRVGGRWTEDGRNVEGERSDDRSAGCQIGPRSCLDGPVLGPTVTRPSTELHPQRTPSTTI